MLQVQRMYFSVATYFILRILYEVQLCTVAWLTGKLFQVLFLQCPINESESGPNILILTNLNSVVLLWSLREDYSFLHMAHATDYMATKDMDSKGAKISGHRCTTYL